MHVPVIWPPGENQPRPDIQHYQPVVAVERVHHIHFPPGPPTPTAVHATAVSLLHTPSCLCERGGKQHLRLLLGEAALAAVVPFKRTLFCNISRIVMGKIYKGLSNSIAASNGHWLKWDVFFWEVYFNPLLVLYPSFFYLKIKYSAN